jgi:hypothetical protein
MSVYADPNCTLCYGSGSIRHISEQHDLYGENYEYFTKCTCVQKLEIKAKLEKTYPDFLFIGNSDMITTILTEKSDTNMLLYGDFRQILIHIRYYLIQQYLKNSNYFCMVKTDKELLEMWFHKKDDISYFTDLLKTPDLIVVLADHVSYKMKHLSGVLCEVLQSRNRFGKGKLPIWFYAGEFDPITRSNQYLYTDAKILNILKTYDQFYIEPVENMVVRHVDHSESSSLMETVSTTVPSETSSQFAAAKSIFDA